MLSKERINLDLLETIAYDIGASSVCNEIVLLYIINQIKNKHKTLMEKHGDIYQLVMVSSKIGEIINVSYNIVSPNIKNFVACIDMCIDSKNEIIDGDSDNIMFIPKDIKLENLYRHIRITKINEILEDNQ